jgi:uncharacterized protein (DUF488 family)
MTASCCSGETRRMLSSATRRVFHTRCVRILTVGHGARTLGDFLAILREAEIVTVADVRTAPGSRRHPQFGQAALRDALAGADSGYVHLPGLGGRRDPRADSRHTALRVEAFRGYADQMESDEFAADLAHLESAARDGPTASLCAETLWWRCHRRMLSDLLAVRGWEVVHLLAPGNREPHRLWDVARVEDGRMVYDGGAMPLPAR